MEGLSVKLGDRIQLEEYRGTVRYIGPVGERDGMWVGVEWKDVFRGKHNGVVDSVRYFDTTDGEASGSFVPAGKFTKGSDLLTAVRWRYSGVDPYVEEDMFFSTTSNESKRIELVGLSKIENRQKKIQLLTAVDVSGSCINHTGSLDEISQSLSSLEELNIAFNLIYRWQMIVDILSALPKLMILNLSGNLFLRSSGAPEPPSADDAVVSVALKTLILNECRIDWSQAAGVTTWLPHLSELQVCTNDIAILSGVNVLALRQLEAIDFSFNQVKDWDEVCRLGELPRLKRLNLTSNPLTSVSFRKDIQNFFASLESLLLGDCCIDEWESVTALDLFPCLRETRLTGNPLLQNVVRGGRFEIVARVGGLTQLNGSGVSPQERIDCERRYVSHVANTLLQNESDLEAALSGHPRYKELVAKHGEPSINVAALKQTGALYESVIDVHLMCHAPSAGTKMGSHTKKVSVNMMLGTLKTLIEKLFSLPKSQMKLYLKKDGQEFPEDITDVRDDKRLGDLYFEDGQQILVNE